MNDNQAFIASYTREIVFLSSGKAKGFADKVRLQLSDLIQNDPLLRNEYDCISWDNRRFLKKSYTTFYSLLKYAQWLQLSGGYVICVLYPDDILHKNADNKANPYYVPRDNVIFELGLFYGALGQDNTYFLFCNSANDITVHNPTDLDGVGNFRYDWDNNTDSPAKNTERLLAIDLFNAINDSAKETIIKNSNKESITAEVISKNAIQYHLTMFNEDIKEKNLKIKPQEYEEKSTRTETMATTSSEKQKKDSFPKPLTRGIDSN